MNDDRANRWAERQAHRDARWADRQARRDARGHSIARSIKGPVMLITVGVLFALQNFTPYGFEQTWPVLLVVAGLLSLLGRVATPPPPPVNPAAPPPPYGWPPPPTAAPPTAGDYRTTGYAQSPYSAAAPPHSGTAPEQESSNPGGAK